MRFLHAESTLHGQPGGKAFQFLEVTNSARVAALGGDAVAIHDNDLDLPYHNPAMLNADMRHELVLNYVNYFAGVNYGYASAATALKKGTIAGGIHYLNYGKFQGADENGTLTNTFKAADYSINILYSRPLDSLFTIGLTMKSIFSDLETYNSSAIAVDVGLMYHNPVFPVQCRSGYPQCRLSGEYLLSQRGHMNLCLLKLHLAFHNRSNMLPSPFLLWQIIWKNGTSRIQQTLTRKKKKIRLPGLLPKNRDLTWHLTSLCDTW